MNELLETVSRIVRGNRQTVWQPDFSLILTGEDNKGEMLGIFIRESRKDLDRLHGALERMSVRQSERSCTRTFPCGQVSALIIR